MRSSSLLTLVTIITLVLPAPPARAENTNTFIDDDNSRFQPYIEAVAAHGLLSGCNPPNNDRVCPHHLVTRGSMAIMLARAIRAPEAENGRFTDIDGHIAERAIDALTAGGVQMGCGEDRFCPDRPITRGEMAVLIARVFKWETNVDVAGYRDASGSPFGPAMVTLADRGGLLACDAPLNSRLCAETTVRREEAALALSVALGLDPLATDPEPQPAARIGFDDGFDDLALWDGRTPSSRNRVRLTDDGFRGQAMRVSIPKGSHYGADFHLHLDRESDQVPESLYFRYYLKLDKDWKTNSSGKLPGFSGVYGHSGKGGYQSRSSDPGWSARLMFTPARGEDTRVGLGYYVYHLGQETRYGDGMRWNEAGHLRPGEWYCLEGEVRLNTLGLADGALRAWVDGTPAFDLSGLEFRRPSEPEIKIESFWFNVYYGGKPTAPKDLGLIIDEVVVDTGRVGCGAGEGTNRTSVGDFNGSGYLDRIGWDTCPGGTCFWIEQKDLTGKTVTRHQGDGAWFSLETHRLGLATGDFDGNGLTDIAYPGRCDDSARCWRVHSAGDGMETGSNWGAEARFAGTASAIAVGDWNGDGVDDLAYEGLCGSDARRCWRVHLSTGDSFASPHGWGVPLNGVTALRAADIDGDGRDDIVYQAPCDEDRCWYTQLARDGSFLDPIVLGAADEKEGNLQWIDFDGDGAADLVTWVGEEVTSTIAVRLMEPSGLGSTVPVAQLDRQIRDVTLRRLEESSAVQALVEVNCEGGETCVEYMVAAPSRILAPLTPEAEKGKRTFRDWVE